MAPQKQDFGPPKPSAFLIILLAVLVLLIVVNTANALHQSSMNGNLSNRDIYTRETDIP